MLEKAKLQLNRDSMNSYQLKKLKERNLKIGKKNENEKATEENSESKDLENVDLELSKIMHLCLLLKANMASILKIVTYVPEIFVKYTDKEACEYLENTYKNSKNEDELNAIIDCAFAVMYISFCTTQYVIISIFSITLLWKFALWRRIVCNKGLVKFFDFNSSWTRLLYSLVLLRVYLFCLFQVIFDVWWLLNLVTLMISPSETLYVIKEAWNYDINANDLNELKEKLYYKMSLLKERRAFVYGHYIDFVGQAICLVFPHRFAFWNFTIHLKTCGKYEMNENTDYYLLWCLIQFCFSDFLYF